MYCLFSDTPRFSDTFLTDQMCHQIGIALYLIFQSKVSGNVLKEISFKKKQSNVRCL